MTNLQAASLESLVSELKMCRNVKEIGVMLTGVSIGLGFLGKNNPNSIFMTAELVKIAKHFGIDYEDLNTLIPNPDAPVITDKN